MRSNLPPLALGRSRDRGLLSAASTLRGKVERDRKGLVDTDIVGGQAATRPFPPTFVDGPNLVSSARPGALELNPLPGERIDVTRDRECTSLVHPVAGIVRGDNGQSGLRISVPTGMSSPGDVAAAPGWAHAGQSSTSVTPTRGPRARHRSRRHLRFVEHLPRWSQAGADRVIMRTADALGAVARARRSWIISSIVMLRRTGIESIL